MSGFNGSVGNGHPWLFPVFTLTSPSAPFPGSLSLLGPWGQGWAIVGGHTAQGGQACFPLLWAFLEVLVETSTKQFSAFGAPCRNLLQRCHGSRVMSALLAANKTTEGKLNALTSPRPYQKQEGIGSPLLSPFCFLISDRPE